MDNRVVVYLCIITIMACNMIAGYIVGFDKCKKKHLKDTLTKLAEHEKVKKELEVYKQKESEQNR